MKRKRIAANMKRSNRTTKDASIKKTKKALKDSMKQFGELADLLPQIVYEIDAESDLIFMNRTAFEMSG